MTAPDQLRLQPDGRITMRDGSDPTEYLKRRMAEEPRFKVGPVCVVPREALHELWSVYEEWKAMRHLMLCA